MVKFCAHTHAAKLVVEITESWANNDITDVEFGLEGYVMFRKDRIGRREDEFYYTSRKLYPHMKYSYVTVTCAAVKTKFDSYCSFRVFADANLERLLTPSVWPSGVLVREFV